MPAKHAVITRLTHGRSRDDVKNVSPGHPLSSSCMVLSLTGSIQQHNPVLRFQSGCGFWLSCCLCECYKHTAPEYHNTAHSPKLSGCYTLVFDSMPFILFFFEHYT